MKKSKKGKKERKWLNRLGWLVAFPVQITRSLAGKGPKVLKRTAVIVLCWASYAVLLTAGVMRLPGELKSLMPKREAKAKPKIVEETPVPTEPPILPSGIELNPLYKDEPIGVGERKNILFTVVPIEAEDRSLTWDSSDPSVAVVDEYGAVMGIEPGFASISAKTVNGLERIMEVEVKPSRKATMRLQVKSYPNGAGSDDWAMLYSYDDRPTMTVYGSQLSHKSEYLMVEGRKLKLFFNIYNRSDSNNRGIQSDYYTIDSKNLKYGASFDVEVWIDGCSSPFVITCDLEPKDDW